ncbi:HET domain-containing protein [Microdochium nivale]|nr:HET domain-containing protein [Microdochium nivale]
MIRWLQKIRTSIRNHVARTPTPLFPNKSKPAVDAQTRAPIPNNDKPAMDAQTRAPIPNNDKPAMDAQTRDCEICDTPLPSAVACRPRLDRHGYLYKERTESKSIIEESADWGCETCSSLFQTISKYYGTDVDSHLKFSTSGNMYSLRTFEDCVNINEDWWQFVVSARNSPTNVLNGRALASADNQDATQHFRPSSCGRTGCRWCEEVPRTNCHPTGDTGSKEAMQILRRWLSECINEHPDCGGDQQNILPKRVLEILDHNSAETRLLVTNEAQVDRYACLSHRWCTETNQVALKRRDLNLFQQRIPQNRLYPLLRDAIRAAGELGLRYIWIDCMCIVQDDEDDWNREAVKMASIYERAHITLAGASSEDGQDGLFRRCTTYTSVEVINAHATQDSPVVEMRLPLYSQDQPSLLSRGWVFQEIQLSRRLVLFAPNELTWECICTTRCECGNCKNSLKILPDNVDSWQGSIFSQYGDPALVSTFSSKTLTKVEDRLPAMAGLASRFNSFHKDFTYVAGLWLENLAEHGLFWETTDDKQRTARPRQLFSPTWSWASVSSPVHFPKDSYYLGPKITVHGCEIVPVEGGNEYGRLQKAYLRVSGFMASGNLSSYDLLSGPSTKMGTAPRSMVKMHSTDQTIPFIPDYELSADAKHRVVLGSEIFVLFGYIIRHTTAYGTKCGTESGTESGTDSSDDESVIEDESGVLNDYGVWKGYLRRGRFPGGIAVRCVHAETSLFERVGLVDAIACTFDNQMEVTVGNRLRKALKQAVYRDIVLI